MRSTSFHDVGRSWLTQSRVVTFGNNCPTKRHCADTNMLELSRSRSLRRSNRRRECMSRPPLCYAVGTAIAIANVLVPVCANAAVVSKVVDSSVRRPIEQIAVCYGVGWRGAGYYPSILGVRPSCWGAVYPPPAYIVSPPVIYAAPNAVVPVAPPLPVFYYCDIPQGYYPSIPACNSGWRAVPAPP
jgi:hypothetical protein